MIFFFYFAKISIAAELLLEKLKLFTARKKNYLNQSEKKILLLIYIHNLN